MKLNVTPEMSSTFAIILAAAKDIRLPAEQTW